MAFYVNEHSKQNMGVPRQVINREYLSTSSLQSLELRPFGLRRFSDWFHSCIVFKALKTR